MVVYEGSFDHFNGQCVQALGDEILQCIIHKPMARHAALASESRAGDADTEVGTKTFCIGTHMARMRSAFIQYFELRWMQGCHELLFKLNGVDGQCSVHGAGSDLMCLFRYTACTITNTTIRPMPPNSLKLTQVLVGKLNAT